MGKEDRCEEVDRLIATLDGMQGIEAPLYKLEYIVRHLIDGNFVQVNKGTKMGEATWGDVCIHLKEEVGELHDAVAEVVMDIGKVPFGVDEDNVKEEIADILALVVHAALKAGSNMGEIERLACDKMARRFRPPAREGDGQARDQGVGG